MVDMVTKIAANLNGISIAYVMGLVNAVFAMLISYGITLSPQETGATATLINAALVLAFHIGHRVGEATASGAATAHSQASTATKPPTVANGTVAQPAAQPVPEPAPVASPPPPPQP